MIVPWTAGGTADLLARIASQKFSESFGQQFVVDNRPGAGGLIGSEQAAKAAPDGHTLLLATTAPNSVAPSLYAKIENIVVASPFVKSGRIKALAVTSAKRAGALPSIPTIAESGVPGFEAVGWFGVVAPAATPKEVVAKLNSELVRALATPEIKERISSLGAEVVSTTPEGLDQFNRAQIALWAKVVKASGARAE